jgi:hypothetical protein
MNQTLEWLGWNKPSTYGLTHNSRPYIIYIDRPLTS